MNMISVRLPDKLLGQADTFARQMHVSRAEYIRLALETMNREMEAGKRGERLKSLSLRLREESMKVNAELDGADDFSAP
ncbi:MAG: hypothetical protein PHX38_02085 [Sulfuricella sp.]|nr:hypothetical protein [Sulfuricella sp.]